jgi:hypothetical protein
MSSYTGQASNVQELSGRRNQMPYPQNKKLYGILNTADDMYTRQTAL